MASFSQALPEITLKVFGGDDLESPEDFKNRWSLLYFYPKDDTPGCTVQACGYRDNIKGFKELGVNVYGVSLDDLDSHAAFSEKFQLNFPLIYDETKELSEFVGAYGEQEWNGNKYMGLSRDTVLVNPEGKIEKIWRDVDPESTVSDTLQVAEADSPTPYLKRPLGVKINKLSSQNDQECLSSFH